MTAALIVVSAALAGFAVALAWMVVLLKRAALDALSTALNHAAAEIR